MQTRPYNTHTQQNHTKRERKGVFQKGMAAAVGCITFLESIKVG